MDQGQLDLNIISTIRGFIDEEFKKLPKNFKLIEKNRYSFNLKTPIEWHDIVTYSLHNDISILKKFCHFRKLVVNFIIDTLIKELHYKNLTYTSSGSNALTSDYDVSIHGDNKEDLVQHFNELFPNIFGSESGIVFDTNLYAVSALNKISRIDRSDSKAYSIIKDCNKDSCKLYKLITLPKGVALDISNSRSWGFIKLFKYITTKEINILKKNIKKTKIKLLIGDFENGLERFNNIINSNTDESLAAMNKKYNIMLSKVKHARDLMEKHPKNMLFKINLKDAEAEANYYSSESSICQGTYLHVVAELQMGITTVRPTNNEYMDSFIENTADLFKDLNKFSTDDLLDDIVIKISKYFMRLLDAIVKISVEKPDFMIKFSIKKSRDLINKIRIDYRGKKLVENSSNTSRLGEDEVDIKVATREINEFLDSLKIKHDLGSIRIFMLKFIFTTLKEYYKLPHKTTLSGGNFSNYKYKYSKYKYKYLNFKK